MKRRREAMLRLIASTSPDRWPEVDDIESLSFAEAMPGKCVMLQSSGFDYQRRQRWPSPEYPSRAVSKSWKSEHPRHARRPNHHKSSDSPTPRVPVFDPYADVATLQADYPDDWWKRKAIWLARLLGNQPDMDGEPCLAWRPELTDGVLRFVAGDVLVVEHVPSSGRREWVYRTGNRCGAAFSKEGAQVEAEFYIFNPRAP